MKEKFDSSIIIEESQFLLNTDLEFIYNRIKIIAIYANLSRNFATAYDMSKVQKWEMSLLLIIYTGLD